MQKFYISALAAALLCSAGATAQKINVLPSTAEEAYAGLAISPNGKYIAGTDYYTMAGFISDWQSGTVKTSDATDEFGCEWRSVNDNGKAAGFNGPAATFDINGTLTVIGEENTLGEAITSDGKTVCGEWSTASYETHAVIWQDGVMTRLPEPTSEEMGFTVNGTYAKYMSTDGKTIVGYIVDDLSTMPAIVWTFDEATKSYKMNTLCKDYFESNSGDGSKPYEYFMPTGVSGDGKYIALTVAPTGTDDQLPARYNLESGNLTVAKLAEEGSAIVSGTPLVSCAIANDGTLIGYTGDMSNMQERKGYIWKAGEESPKLLAEVYTGVSEFATYDLGGMHCPSVITPDGRYMVGFGMDAEGNIKTYVFEFGGNTTAIEATPSADAAATATPIARYNAAGQKISSRAKGFNIVRMSDGQVRKVIVR